MNIEDKLVQIRYNVDTIPHIKVDLKACDSCQEKWCLYICPVQNYRLEEGKMSFAWQGCVECGACRVACEKGQVVEWNYPRGGYGVCFRYG